MAISLINLSTIGNNARAGNAPQLFSFATTDDLLTTATQQELDQFKELFRRGDWVDQVDDVASFENNLQILFCLGDGSSPCALSATVNAGGTGYAGFDLITVTYVGATMIYESNFRVSAESGGVVTEVTLRDPGLWDPDNPPDGYSALATTTTGGGSGLTLDITPSNLAGLGSTKGQAGLFGPVTITGQPVFEAV